MLEKNIRVNGLTGRVEVRRAGIGGTEGVVRFTRGLDTLNHIVAASDASASGVEIPVTTLEAEQLPLLDLTQYSTVVIGPRAYETSAELRAANPRLFEWVRGGGTRHARGRARAGAGRAEQVAALAEPHH